MNPDDSSRTYTLKSPNYPNNYPNNKNCKWTFVATTGKVKLIIDKFNVEWSSTCKTKDYLYVGQIKKYTKVWLCGSSVPNNFSALTSKGDTMTVKFKSNGSKRKSGFKVRLIANG